jgi:hypothetical protein
MINRRVYGELTAAKVDAILEGLRDTEGQENGTADERR